MSASLHGILPAVVTPFDEHGRFADRPFRQLLERLYGAGCHGVYVGGTTGEGMLQPAAQRQVVVDATVAATPPGRTVVVHVGAASLAETCALARHAEQAGAHAVSSLPPLAGTFPFDDVRRWYAAIAEASRLPLLVYYFPELSGAIRTTEQLEALCAIDRVAGVKFTDFDLFRLGEVASAGPRVFNGRDEVLAAGLLMGACGGIGTFYNVAPELFVEIHAAAAARRWDDARAVQTRVNALIRLTLRYPLFPAVKQMLAWSGIDCGTCLPPREPLDDEQRRALARDLRAAGFDRLAAGA